MTLDKLKNYIYIVTIFAGAIWFSMKAYAQYQVKDFGQDAAIKQNKSTIDRIDDNVKEFKKDNEDNHTAIRSSVDQMNAKVDSVEDKVDKILYRLDVMLERDKFPSRQSSHRKLANIDEK